jgi:Fe-S-cluster containining protein
LLNTLGKTTQFIEQYLRIDEDQDYVLQSVPLFLDTDNSCFIYDVRPKACREFPHTDRKKFQQITELTLKIFQFPCSIQYSGRNEEKLPL